MVYFIIFISWIVLTTIWLTNAAVLYSLERSGINDIKLSKYIYFPMHLIQLFKIIKLCHINKKSYKQNISKGISSCFN
jgi:hypothetical protein